jgi:CRP-like cAMP-binding protein
MANIEIIPFSPGRRPTDEARHHWMGSSDEVAFVLGEEGNACYLLLAISGASGEGWALDATLSGPAGPLPGWDRRPVRPTVFAAGEALLRETPLGADQPYVLALVPERDLPGDYGFAQQFSQRVRVQVRLLHDRAVAAATEADLDVYDVRRFGSLYARLVERLVTPDTARQAELAGVAAPSHAYHPWYPVLTIGAHKAELYTRALIGDVVHKRHNLADPGWLVRVGLSLELLTCLGVIEAVRDEVGDLLDVDERDVFEHDESFAELRTRLNVEGWRSVWDLRRIAFAGRAALRAGPVAAANLLNKKRATLEFLRVHHEDLKYAIELAGPNAYNAQETWHRVFRDAERAVLRQTPDAFPELGHLPPEVRNFVFWHRRGHIGLSRALRVPGPLAGLLGDQDGLFASACNQYRASMNHVADWAKARGLTDHTGEEAVPRQVSLLEAHMNQPSRVALLQRRDGYRSERLEVGAELPAGYEPPLAEVEKLLAGTPVVSVLGEEAVSVLARTARPLTFGPLERIIVQGQPGDSLFVVAEGAVDVVLRRADGTEVNLGTRPHGVVLGEMSLLTGEPRSATVRALDGALVYEVGRRQYEALLDGRPELVDELARVMEDRLHAQDASLAAHDARPGALMRRWLRRLRASA